MRSRLRVRRAGRRAWGTAPAAVADPPLLESETVRQLERLSLAFLDAIVAGVSGQRAGSSAAAGIEFADYRHYAPGDDLRRIDWHVYGRLRELMVKVAPEEGHHSLAILVDASRSMEYGHPNKLRHARRLAAALGAIALLRADAVRIHTLSDGLVESSDRLEGPGLLMALTEEVGRLPAGRGTDLAASLRAHRRRHEPADLAVLITDALVAPGDLAEALHELAGSSRGASLLHVVDRWEAAVGVRGEIRLRDRETGGWLNVDLSGRTALAYADHFLGFCRAVEEGCAAAGVRYLRAPTHVEPLELLAGDARDIRLVGR